jgi:hypothetical protein
MFPFNPILISGEENHKHRGCKNIRSKNENAKISGYYLCCGHSDEINLQHNPRSRIFKGVSISSRVRLHYDFANIYRFDFEEKVALGQPRAA